jgi:hypothetical protein
MRVARWIDADQTSRVLDQASASAAPARSSSGWTMAPRWPTPCALEPLQRGRAQLHRAGLPVQNPFVESFGSCVRDEMLSVEAFDSVIEANGHK